MCALSWKLSGEKWIFQKVPSGVLAFTYSVVLIYASIISSALAAGPSNNDFKFTIEPEDTVGVRGQPLALNCSAQFEGKTPTIQWLRDEVLLNFEGEIRRHLLPKGSLQFDSIEHTRSHRPDEGIYQCVAEVKNLGSIVSRKAQLQIAYLAKTFEAEPKTLSVHMGDTAVFECNIAGAPKPTVHWYKDDLEINTNNVDYHLHLDGNLEIRRVHFTDFGRYKCKVENVDRSRFSEEAQLTQNGDMSSFQGLAPHFIVQPKDQFVLEGSTVELHCAANGRGEDGNPPTITWLKDGVTIDMANLDTRFSKMAQGTLRVLNVLEGDEGMYTCRATNLEDSVDSDATVTVHVAPRFQKRPADTSATIHSDVIFDCDVFGIPEPEIKWMKNGETIITSQYFQISDNGRSLKILGLVDTDQGMYQCFAENQVGNVQASAHLSVAQTGSQDAPAAELPSKPTFVIVAVRSTRFITLTWRPPNDIGSSEILTYTLYWKEDGSERNRMMNTSILEANIQGLEPSTHYTVNVMAVNKAGAGPAATTTVQTGKEVVVPSPPTDLVASTQSSTSINLKWGPPKKPNGIISRYKIFYYKDGEGEEHTIEVTNGGTEHTLLSLSQFTNYNFYVVAHNENGAGTATGEVAARTYSAVPSMPPQNVTIEAVSSTSLVVRWDPPPQDAQNGMITGYKLKVKKVGDRKGVPTTVDAGQKSFALTGLNKGATYQIRLSALNVNGSGEPTEWKDAITYQYDLDESIVPGQPLSLNVRATMDAIMVGWIPPSQRDIRIRGYILGYGEGVPDVYRLVLDHSQRFHTIKNLKAGTTYVISLKAFNNMGEGRPRLADGTTRRESVEERQTPMTPPVGLNAIVLSSSTILLTWIDTGLGRNQRISDTRYYTVRYKVSNIKKYKTINATEVNVHIEDLKPNTEYDFSVKVIKGKRESTWSLSTFNRTLESAPASAPRELTVVGVQGHSKWVTLSWQPPRQANGLVTGYVVLYTTDSNQRDRDWVVNGVIGGEQLSSTIRDLTESTTYFFKIQARNNKGNGPMSPAVVFRTHGADGTGGGPIELPTDRPDDSNHNRNNNKNYKYDFDVDQYFKDKEREAREKIKQAEEDIKKKTASVPPVVLFVSIACVAGVTIIAIVVVAIFVCKRKMENNRKSQYNANNKAVNKPGPKDLKPPDLWIHHEQVELKGMEKNPDGSCPEEMKPLNPEHHHHSGDRNYDPRDTERYHRTPVRTKPIMISVDQPPPPREPIATAIPNGHLMMHSGSGGYPEEYDDDEVDMQGLPLVQPTPIRPTYPRTQYQYTSTPRVNAGDLSQPSSEDYYTSTLERRKPHANYERMKKHGSTSRLTGPHSPLESPAYSNQHAPIPYDQLQHHHHPPPQHLQSHHHQIPPPEYQKHQPPQPQHYPSPPSSTCGSVASQPSSSHSQQLQSPDGSKSLQRPGNPLKSFAMPGPPGHQHQLNSSGTSSVPKHIVKPQQTSPYKKPNPPSGGSGGGTPVKHGPGESRSMNSPPDVTLRSEGESDIPKSFSTEELTAEMANLEGLMKDLNAITQTQFEC